jgi:peptidoglycan lytic transglycosylase
MYLAKQIILTTALSLVVCAVTWSQDIGENSARAPLDESSRSDDHRAPEQTGVASYYHVEFQGRRTASGEKFNQNSLTAAHRTLPFGTLVRVINLRNLRSVVLRVTDRGPMQKNRIIDVTQRAARELGFLALGMTWVKLEVVPLGDLSDLEGN